MNIYYFFKRNELGGKKFKKRKKRKKKSLEADRAENPSMKKDR